MRPFRRSIPLLALALPALAAAQPAAEPPAAAAAAPPALVNVRDPLAGVRTGGLAPESEDTEALFAALAAEGFGVYIDLRTEEEGLDAARAAAEAAGLAYVSIPVGTEGDLDLESVRSLDAALDDPARGPAVVACASGNRSGALLALRAFWLDGVGAEEALALGKQAGLTRFEPQVRALLGLPPLPPAETKTPETPAAPPS